MSAVTKCDICGKIYDEETVEATVSSIITTYYSEGTGDRYPSTIDLCPDCTKKVKDAVKAMLE